MPAVAGLASGGFAIAWVRSGLGGSLNAVQLRIYDALGTATTAPLTIDSNTSLGVFDPDIAAFASGNLLVAYRIGTGDLSFAIRDLSGGLVLGPTTLAGSGAIESDVALAYHVQDGVQSILAVWEDSGAEDGSGYAIRGRYITATGAFSGAEFTLNAQTTGDQVNPDIAANAAGLNAVVWTDLNANSGDIKLRTVTNVTGGAQIAEMTVNSGTAGLQDNAAVAILTSGAIVVAWESGSSVYFRVVNSAGVFQTGEVLISNAGADPQVSATSDGGFVLVYRQNGLDGSGGTLRMAAYDSSYNRVGVFITANTTTLNDQERPDIAILEDGRHILAFSDESTGPNDDVRYQVMDARPQSFSGSAGDDTLVGRPNGMNFANDVAFGLGGNDVFHGLSGDDTFWGGDGDDTGIGGAGNDYMVGEQGADALWGEDGDDTLWGGAGNDYLVGAGGNDTMWGEDGDDTLWGGAGNDLLVGGPGDDALWGEEGDDTLWGNSGSNYLVGGPGNDAIWGDVGNDTLWGGTGSDTLVGLTGDDTLWGEDGDDFLWGGDGNDTLIAGLGSEVLRGEAGDDTLWGGSDGVDWLVGGPGNDILWGEGGQDFFYFDSLDVGFDHIQDLAKGEDYVAFNSAAFGISSLTAGGNFISGGSPVSVLAAPTLLFNTNTYILSYDPDGTGAAAAIQIARTYVALDAADFVFS